MAIFFNQNVGLVFNGVDLSDHVTSATLNYKYDSIETTSMGQLAHDYIGGLQSGDLSITFNNDTATGSVLQKLNAAIGTKVTITVQQDKTAAISATNPKYSGYFFIDTVTPIAGDVGALAQQQVTFQLAAAPSTATTPYTAGCGIVVSTT
jgi:hypothetical protein